MHYFLAKVLHLTICDSYCVSFMGSILLCHTEGKQWDKSDFLSYFF